MQITINLEDPKSCKGCPMLEVVYRLRGNIYSCALIYYSEWPEAKRHQRCIDENGE